MVSSEDFLLIFFNSFGALGRSEVGQKVHSGILWSNQINSSLITGFPLAITKGLFIWEKKCKCEIFCKRIWLEEDNQDFLNMTMDLSSSRPPADLLSLQVR